MAENLAELKLRVEGIHCAHCADDLIEGTLLKLAGVTKASYDSSNSILAVVYEPQTVSETELKRLVGEWGYELKPLTTQEPGPSGRYKIISVIVALLVLAIFIWWVRNI